MIFDTHVHLNARQFQEDRDEVIQRAFSKGVKYMTVVGFDRETIPLALKIAEQYETIYAAVGWHPVDAIDMTAQDLNWLKELYNHPNVVAVGEMGLDYHWDKSQANVQKEVCRKKIRIPNEQNMPNNEHNQQ